MKTQPFISKGIDNLVCFLTFDTCNAYGWISETMKKWKKQYSGGSYCPIPFIWNCRTADCCVCGNESDQCCGYLSGIRLRRHMSKLLGAMIMFCSLIELRGWVRESKLSECIVCLIVCKSCIKKNNKYWTLVNDMHTEDDFPDICHLLWNTLKIKMDY